MSWFIAYIDDDGKPIVKEFETQETMVTCAKLFKLARIEILCVWTETKKEGI